eukprot:sb/3475867/
MLQALLYLVAVWRGSAKEGIAAPSKHSLTLFWIFSLPGWMPFCFAKRHSRVRIRKRHFGILTNRRAHSDDLLLHQTRQLVGALRSFAAKSRAPPLLRIVIAPSFQLQSQNDLQVFERSRRDL